MFEVFSTPEFMEALLELLKEAAPDVMPAVKKGLMEAIPKMQLALDSGKVTFPQPTTVVPILKGALDGIEAGLKKEFGIK